MLKRALLITVFAILALPFLAQAQTNPASTNYGVDTTVSNVPPFQSQVATKSYDSNWLASKAGTIVGVILSFVGVIFLGLMIYAGLMWMMAQGNEQEVEKAKDLITSSIIGLIIVFAAYALTAFIGQKFLQ